MALFRGPGFIFIHFPKTGGGTIFRFINSKNGSSLSSLTDHVGIWDVMKKEEVGNELKFGCIRNPFEWYVSWWSYLKVHGRPHHKKMFSEIGCWEDFTVFVKYILSSDYAYGIKYDFKKMLKYDIGIVTYLYINDFCNYDKVYGNERISKSITDKYFLMDKVIDMHDIDDKVPKLLKVKKTDWLSQKRRHATSHNHYSTYYDDESIDLVSRKDAIILTTFGYEFEKCE